MKRPLLFRILYALLFLILFALTTLTSRTFLFSHSPVKLETFRSHSQPRFLTITPQFNTTILEFVEIDLSEPKFDRETQKLLEPDFLQRYIAFIPPNHDHEFEF